MLTTLRSLASTLSFIIAITPTLSQLPNGKIGCFVDLSDESDRKTDIVTFSNQSIIAYKQHKGDASMQERFREYAQFNTGDNVVSVSAMDWTKNGVADLFVVTQLTQDSYHLNVWKDENQQFVPSGAQPLELSDKHVLILDANSDFFPDVFGKTSESEGFFFGNPAERRFSEFSPLGVDKNTIIMQSASFIDLNQDCTADLVYITKDNDTDGIRHLKMISGTDFGNTARITSIDLHITLLDEYQSRLYFADINSDGIMDIIIPNRNENKLHIFIQDTSQALGFKELCRKKRPVEFKPSGGCDVTLKTEDGFYLQDHLPIIVQDINMDSKTNLVSLLENASGEQKVFVTTINFKSIEDLNGKQLLENKGIASLFNPYTDSGDITDLAFFHSGEFPLGLHFLIERKDEPFVFINLEPVLNDQNYGFLSVCPLNDVDAVKKKYGGTMPGVTVKAFFRSSNGQEIFLNSASLYQTNSGNHLLPFIVIGLGEPESYIEKLVIGYSLHGGRVHYFQQPGVPPNSQLVLFAYGERWRLETFLAPYITATMLAVIIALVMSVLGGIWVYLEIQERTDGKLKGSPTTNNFFF